MNFIRNFATDNLKRKDYNMNTILINNSLYNYVSRCAKHSSMDVNTFVEAVLKYGLDDLYPTPGDAGIHDCNHTMPKAVLVAAAEYAISECNAGKGIPNDDVESVIADRRGWK